MVNMSALSGLYWSDLAEATSAYTLLFFAQATAKFRRLILYPLLVIVSDGNCKYVYVRPSR